MSPHTRFPRPRPAIVTSPRSRRLRRRARAAWPSILTAGLAAFSAACGPKAVETEPPAAPRATEAMVRVVNRTSADVRVEVDGRALGEVPSGGEHFFVGIAPGTVDLRGRSLDGQLAFRRDLLTLEAGETFTWVLREGEAAAPGGAPAAGAGAVSAEGATIVVVNVTEWDVQVVLDGQVLGTTSAGRTGRYEGIAPGPHRLEARAPETSFPQEFPVLEPGETFTWRLRGPGTVAAPGILPAPGTGRLRVENPNPEAVRVLVNGVHLGDVEPRQVRIFENLSAASMRLSGESRDGSTRFEGPIASIEPGRVTTWRVGAGLPGDVAGPSAGRAAAVDADRDGVPGDASSAGDPYDPDALPDAGEPGERAATEELPPPPPADAVLPAPGAEGAGKVFVVENRTTQDLQVFLDGTAVGVVGAGMTERFSSLPGVRFIPSAKSATGAREFRHPEVDLEGRQSFSWIISP